jgi:hypothetical protein
LLPAGPLLLEARKQLNPITNLSKNPVQKGTGQGNVKIGPKPVEGESFIKKLIFLNSVNYLFK